MMKKRFYRLHPASAPTRDAARQHEARNLLAAICGHANALSESGHLSQQEKQVALRISELALKISIGL